MDTIYLDNAATTWPKPEQVYRAVDTAMREHGANPGRGAYRMSVEAQRIVDDARLAVARLFNAPSADRVVFTTSALDVLEGKAAATAVVSDEAAGDDGEAEA
jgi:selenocysteine lyase/cysteine desulfurase